MLEKIIENGKKWIEAFEKMLKNGEKNCEKQKVYSNKMKKIRRGGVKNVETNVEK